MGEENIGWIEALSILKRVVVSADSFEIDKICNSLLDFGILLQFVDYANLLMSNDFDTLARILTEEIQEDESIIIVSEVSYILDCGPFLFTKSEFTSFVTSHFARYGISFFDGDVVVLFSRSRRLLMLHHNGMYAISNPIP